MYSLQKLKFILTQEKVTQQQLDMLETQLKRDIFKKKIVKNMDNE